MKLFHLHLIGSNNNISTLVCRLEGGSIRYIYYGGSGSSGTPFALSNIQFYDLVGGQISWNRRTTLPVENLEGESKEAFTERCIKLLNNSTDKVHKVVNTEVSFS